MILFFYNYRSTSREDEREDCDISLDNSFTLAGSAKKGDICVTESRDQSSDYTIVLSPVMDLKFCVQTLWIVQGIGFLLENVF